MKPNRYPIPLMDGQTQDADIACMVWIEPASALDNRTQSNFVLFVQLSSDDTSIVAKFSAELSIKEVDTKAGFGPGNPIWNPKLVPVNLEKARNATPIPKSFFIHHRKNFPQPRIVGTIAVRRPGTNQVTYTGKVDIPVP